MAIANILVVEDESVIALDIKRSLIQLGYAVVAIADTAETALETIAQVSPDLILMDIHLRGTLDGINAAHYIREQFHLPVVFLTAHADAATLSQAKATLPFGYIVKPFEIHDLSTAIEVALSRHQAEVAMQQALQRERDLNDLKTQFVSIVSHEFRNPLSSIQFCLDLLSRTDADLPLSKKTLYIQRAQDSVERMRQLLEEVLILGEVEGSHQVCHPAPVNLVWFCRNLVEEFQNHVKRLNHAIIFSCHGVSAAQEPFYWLDVKLLRHILVNLLSNAIKYSPSGGKILFDLTCQSASVKLRVQDHGIGIPAEDRDQLFNRFHRGGNVGNIPGTGLGLSIVKQCVDAHQGTIHLESEVGGGTVFTVTLHCKSDM